MQGYNVEPRAVTCPFCGTIHPLSSNDRLRFLYATSSLDTEAFECPRCHRIADARLWTKDVMHIRSEGVLIDG